MGQQYLDRLRRLVAGMQNPACFDHDVRRFETIETHISIVLLTGDFAYKFKKPVDLDFVDFTSLDKRRHYCEEELRLNRRLAPNLYLDVVAIGGSVDHPRPGSLPAIEYCVKMRQFPHSAELEHVLAHKGVSHTDFSRLAATIAAFHDGAAAVSPDSSLGTAGEVRRQCLDNFDTMGADLPQTRLGPALGMLRRWTQEALDHCETLINQRHEHGRVRECHGDMHVTNMIWLENRIQVFDCIEFNEEFRWIDVMSEIAFLLMDLDMRGHTDLGRVFLNAYLEAGGDYEGLGLLRLFRVYRSMVRAKIAFLRASEDAADSAILRRFSSHVELARRYTERTDEPALVITHGFSGSGKTTVTTGLIPLIGAVRVRSDIERKRLEGLAASERSHSGVGEGLYDPLHTEQTYGRLADCAHNIIRAGLPAIVDATFLNTDQRRRFRNLARSLGVPFRILDCQAPESVLRERITVRSRQGTDASEADVDVLGQQLASAQPLTAEEQACLVPVDTASTAETADLARRLGLGGSF